MERGRERGCAGGRADGRTTDERAFDIVVAVGDELKLMVMVAARRRRRSSHSHSSFLFDGLGLAVLFPSFAQYHEARSKEWNGMQMRREKEAGRRAGGPAGEGRE